MGTENSASVFQLGSGMWAFRYTYTQSGKRVSKQVSKDENGNPFKSRRAATRARQVAIDNVQNSRKPKPTVRKTIQEVYQEYCATGRRRTLRFPAASSSACFWRGRCARRTTCSCLTSR